MWFLSVTFSFYKQFLWVSLLLNLILLSLDYDIPVILFIKLCFAVGLWGWYKTEGRSALVFFHNFRINAAKLLLTCLFYDLLIFLLTLLAYYSFA